MSYLDEAVNTQTVTVATETALVSNSVNDLVGVPGNARCVITVSVAAAAGTGGTTFAVKLRQGSGVAGTQVGPTVSSPVGTAGAGDVVSYTFVDTAPPATGQYTATITYTANTSSVVTSSIVVLVDSGILE